MGIIIGVEPVRSEGPHFASVRAKGTFTGGSDPHESDSGVSGRWIVKEHSK